MKTLAQKTQEYWRVSSSWNGRGSKMTTQGAIGVLREVRLNVGPQRPLSLRAEILNAEIIQGKKEVKRAQR